MENPTNVFQSKNKFISRNRKLSIGASGSFSTVLRKIMSLHRSSLRNYYAAYRSFVQKFWTTFLTWVFNFLQKFKSTIKKAVSSFTKFSFFTFLCSKCFFRTHLNMNLNHGNTVYSNFIPNWTGKRRSKIKCQILYVKMCVFLYYYFESVTFFNIKW